MPNTFCPRCGDKQTTSVMLAAAGIPTPAGCTLPAGGSIPAGFRFPAVLKSRESAGCDGLTIIQNTADFVTPETDSRLECHIAGIPGSVSCLCRAESIIPLVPFEQMFMMHCSRFTSRTSYSQKIIMLECSRLQYGRLKLSAEQHRRKPMAGSELI